MISSNGRYRPGRVSTRRRRIVVAAATSGDWLRWWRDVAKEAKHSGPATRGLSSEGMLRQLAIWLNCSLCAAAAMARVGERGDIIYMHIIYPYPYVVHYVSIYRAIVLQQDRVHSKSSDQSFDSIIRFGGCNLAPVVYVEAIDPRTSFKFQY